MACNSSVIREILTRREAERRLITKGNLAQVFDWLDKFREDLHPYKGERRGRGGGRTTLVLLEAKGFVMPKHAS